MIRQRFVIRALKDTAVQMIIGIWVEVAGSPRRGDQALFPDLFVNHEDSGVRQGVGRASPRAEGAFG